MITFQDISEAFNTELNKSSAGITIARLSHENGRVSLYLKPDTQLTNLKNSRRYREGIKDQTRQIERWRTPSRSTKLPSTTRRLSTSLATKPTPTPTSTLKGQRRFLNRHVIRRWGRGYFLWAVESYTFSRSRWSADFPCSKWARHWLARKEAVLSA